MKKLASFAAILLVTGCATTSEPKMDAAMDYESLLKEATASVKKAGSMGGEWRDSGKLLDKAQAAAKAGDVEKAIKLLKKAKDEGDLGYAQASSQQNAGPWLF